MENGWLFVTGIRDGLLMCVVTDADADIGMVAYEMPSSPSAPATSSHRKSAKS